MSSSRPVRPRGFWRALPALWLAAASTVASATSIAPAFADPGQLQNASSRSQRTLADDYSLDQVLVAPPSRPGRADQLTSTSATAASAVPTAANAEVAEAEAEQQIASLGPAMRPLHPRFVPVWPSVGEITTYFGEVGPYAPRGHAGLDIAADSGTPILAADDGEVLKAYWNEDGYGGLIVIEHPSGYETWYGHLSRLGVEKGEHVDRGEMIGRMGSTGYSTGPHLHFEVRQEGDLRDPLMFLAESALQHAN